MRRGKRAGEMYVALTVDGSGINKDIIDSVDDASDGVSDAGERHGDSYSAGFLDRMQARLPFLADRLRERMTSAGQDAGSESGDKAGESFTSGMIDRVKGLGDKISAELGDRMASRPEAMRRGIDRAFDDDFADRIGNRFADRLTETLGDRIEETIAGALTQMNDMLDAQKKSGVSGNRGTKSESDGLSVLVGRLLGSGSRNNFLNFIGKSVTNVLGLFGKLGSMVTGFVSTFSKGMDKAGEGAGFFSKMMSGAGASGSAMMTSLAKSGPVAAGVILILIAVASVLVSVMSALLAIVTALVSTIASALVGAAAVGGGALIALASAAGLVAVAFTSMTNAQKDLLSESFQPLKAELVGLGQLMLRDMVPAFATWSKNLQDSLFLLAPVAEVMGAAFAEAGNTLTAAFSGPGFQAMAFALGVYLPSIVGRLSAALGGFLNGSMGLFAAIMPMVNRFAGYLDNVGQRFSKWANSAQGQNAIVDFVDRAVVSLRSLWDFTGQVMGFIGDLLFSRQAQGAGNTIFDSMATAFEGFRRKLNKAIADGTLEEWFSNAIDFGEALWGVIKSLGTLFATLDNSGVLDAFAFGLSLVAGGLEMCAILLDPLMDILEGRFPAAINVSIDAVGRLASALMNVLGLMGQTQMYSAGTAPVTGSAVSSGSTAAYEGGTPSATPTIDYGSLINLGNTALDNTYESAGGYMPNPTKPEYKNPYTQWAQQFIEQGPTVAEQVKAAIRTVQKQFNAAIRQAAKADTLGEARSLISTSIESAKSVAQSMVDGARSALSSAAQNLASANSPGEAARALAALRRTQGALRNAVKNQDRIEKAMARLGKQKIVSGNRVNRLLDGQAVSNATLADYAAAREKLTVRIAAANRKLVDAIAMRDDYRTAVTDAVKAFGSLMTAQAKMVDGVEQALTASDITSNLQDRLAQIRTFQENLRKLLALGLGNEAYKQLVDAGVEEGGRFAEALLAGGYGAVADVNSLTGQISDIANSLGLETSSRLYQAGVDAAKGLVDGLKSMSAQLDSAAIRLGNSIAAALKKALGISGGGGGGNQGNRRQGTDLAPGVSGRIAQSPEVAAYAARQGRGASSGDGDPRFRDLIVHTPTKDPEAVAREVLNEVTGRL